MCQTVSAENPSDRPDANLSTTMLLAIAELEDVPPEELDFVLGDHVDVFAFDSLLRQRSEERSNVRVSLEFRDYRVVAESSGRVTIADRCDDPGDCVAATETDV